MIYIKNTGNRDDLFISYPNGEFGINSNVFINLDKIEINIEFKDSYYCEDILKLHMILEFLMQKGYKDKISLHFNYLPFSREDREENGRIFTFKYVSNLLYLDIIEWYVDDLHSNKLHNVPVNLCLFPVGDYDVIIFPDKGSYEKYGSLIGQKSYLVYNKTRDINTGKLIESHLFRSMVSSEHLGKVNLRCLIIDDICSYGNTFRMIPKDPDWTYDLFTVYNEGLVDSIEGIDKIIYKHMIDFRRKK